MVDDEPQILRALRINLSVRGYDVVTASTGAGALRAAAERRPDVVVLDLGLPDIDGIEVLAGLARLDARTGDRALGADRFGGQGRRAGRRRRRLRHQAVRYGRVPGPLARGAAARGGLGGHRRTGGGHRFVHRRPGREEGPQGRRRSTSDPHRVGYAGDAGAQPRKIGRPHRAAAGGLGAGLCRPRPTTYGSIWPSCAANSRTTRPIPGTC